MTGAPADFLVIGSGIAGLWFAQRVADHGRVTIITKKAESESNTNYAQGGIAAAVDSDDNAQLHYEDTLRAGGGIAHPDAVRIVTESGPALVRRLFELGVSFTTYADARGRSHFDLGQEGGHRRRRIVHAQDFTGMEIERGLLGVVRAHPNVTMLEEHFAVDLALSGDGRCCGAWVLDKTSGRLELATAPFTLLASGGIGQAWRYTTNPRIATGDGIAMGFRAGAEVANMEFIQFHPTSLYGHRLDDRVFLISEAVRGEGAVLRTRAGRAFMPEYHPDAELAPRDVVARAIATELSTSGDEFVLLDTTHLDPARLRQRFPNIHQTCLRLGLDITRQPIPVVPAAHYVCGGIRTTVWAESSIPGLFAAGECACSGLHGANRLASNSLLEALVFADRAATRAIGLERPVAACTTAMQAAPMPAGETRHCEDLLGQLQATMWAGAGILRTDHGLAETSRRIALIARGASSAGGVPGQELRNLVTISRLVVECARRRKESRGLHYNQDHAETDPHFAQDTVVTRAEVETGTAD